MKNKGQGVFEYLFLLGGAVLIAAVVISLLSLPSNRYYISEGSIEELIDYEPVGWGGEDFCIFKMKDGSNVYLSEDGCWALEKYPELCHSNDTVRSGDYYLWKGCKTVANGSHVIVGEEALK